MRSSLLNDPIRCLLLRPEFLDQTFYNMTEVLRLLGVKSSAPPLGLMVLGALLPKSWELRLVDGDVEPITDEQLAWADIVMIGGIAPQQIPMLALVDRAQNMGKPVVVGGSGPSLQPEVYRRADFVVSGEVEVVLDELLADLAAGKTSGTYRAARAADLSRAVTPRYDLARLDQYLFVGLGSTRGCPFNCEFCAQIEIFGRDPRYKSPEQVVAEMQCLYDLGFRGQIDLGYDNLAGDLNAARMILTAMREWSQHHGFPFFFTSEVTLNVARQPDLLELMRDNDFRYLFVGIESADDDVLNQAKKGQNTGMSVVEATRTLNEHGIAVNTGLILGFDGETDDTATQILSMVQATGAFPALVLPLHALPGTALHRRLTAEGRLFAGSIEMNTDERTDTATTGLNFVTRRPRVAILRDLARLLEALYDPRSHHARVELVTRQLRPGRKYRAALTEILSLPIIFARAAWFVLRAGEGLFFLASVFRTLLRNPEAIDVAVGTSVFNANYRLQARSYVAALRKQIAHVESVGEDSYNAERLAQDPDLPLQGAL
jgi:radical SAM superfamily enzyme YgiQ (UPF0313 family)